MASFQRPQLRTSTANPAESFRPCSGSFRVVTPARGGRHDCHAERPHGPGVALVVRRAEHGPAGGKPGGGIGEPGCLVGEGTLYAISEHVERSWRAAHAHHELERLRAIHTSRR